MQASNCESPRIIDAFLAKGEIELYKIRISDRKSLVELVVIGESNFVFDVTPKPLNPKDWLSKFLHLSQRVMTKRVNLDESDAWQCEPSTREALLDFLIANCADAGCIVSDFDEIPSRSQIAVMCEVKKDYHYWIHTLYRKANWSTSEWSWNKAVSKIINETGWPNLCCCVKLTQPESKSEGCYVLYLGFEARPLQNVLKGFYHVEIDFTEIDRRFFLDCYTTFLFHLLGAIETDTLELLDQFACSELLAITKELQSYKPELTQIESRSKLISAHLVTLTPITIVDTSDELTVDTQLLITGFRSSPVQRPLIDCLCHSQVSELFVKINSNQYICSVG
jgi:hypothetical protein